MRATQHIAGSLGLVLLSLTACSSDVPATQHVQLAKLGFDVPAEWQRTDSKRHGAMSAEWRPDDNERKESLVVTRTELGSIAKDAGVDEIDRLVVEAQKSFDQARITKPRHITTRSGWTGAITEVDFVPSGSKRTYHRVHAVLVDAQTSALIHVLYTAQTPDPKLRSLDLVIDSIRRQEV